MLSKEGNLDIWTSGKLENSRIAVGLLEEEPYFVLLAVFWKDVQGGSDKSGPLSKPHRLVKKSYILLIISLKPSQIFVEAETFRQK